MRCSIGLHLGRAVAVANLTAMQLRIPLSLTTAPALANALLFNCPGAFAVRCMLCAMPLKPFTGWCIWLRCPCSPHHSRLPLFQQPGRGHSITCRDTHALLLASTHNSVAAPRRCRHAQPMVLFLARSSTLSNADCRHPNRAVERRAVRPCQGVAPRAWLMQQCVWVITTVTTACGDQVRAACYVAVRS